MPERIARRAIPPALPSGGRCGRARATVGSVARERGPLGKRRRTGAGTGGRASTATRAALRKLAEEARAPRTADGAATIARPPTSDWRTPSSAPARWGSGPPRTRPTKPGPPRRDPTSPPPARPRVIPSHAAARGRTARRAARRPRGPGEHVRRAVPRVLVSHRGATAGLRGGRGRAAA